MNGNEVRIRQIVEVRAQRLRRAAQINPLDPFLEDRVAPQVGDSVTCEGVPGVIDAVFFDLQAAVACSIIDSSWYIDQKEKPKTLPTERWFSVILPHGAVLLGEKDL